MRDALTEALNDILTGFLWTVGALLAVLLFSLLGLSPWGK